MAAINDNGHYHAELSVVDGELESSCECSVGMNGGLCKHGEFSRLIAAIRGDDKRKRSLMLLLDQTFPPT